MRIPGPSHRRGPRFRADRRADRRAIGALSALALVLAGVAGAATVAGLPNCPLGSGDKSGTNWLRTYTTACDTLRAMAADCRLCHVTVAELNPYGLDLFDVGNQPLLVADLDSDGDGRSNGQEIAECTPPGTFDVPLADGGVTWGALKSRWR